MRAPGVSGRHANRMSEPPPGDGGRPEREAHVGWRQVDPSARSVLFVNPRSGGGKASHAELAENARARGIRCVVLEPGQELAGLVREEIAGGADSLGMAGGD